MKALPLGDTPEMNAAAIDLPTRDQLCALQAAAWRAERESRIVDANLLRELWRSLAAPQITRMAA